MNTVISNKSGETLELAKRLLYSVKVLSIGLFIPFLFLFGITLIATRRHPGKWN